MDMCASQFKTFKCSLCCALDAKKRWNTSIILKIHCRNVSRTMFLNSHHKEFYTTTPFPLEENTFFEDVCLIVTHDYIISTGASHGIVTAENMPQDEVQTHDYNKKHHCRNYRIYGHGYLTNIISKNTLSRFV